MPSLHFKDNGQDVVFPIAEGETPQKALVRYKAYKMYGVDTALTPESIGAAGEAAKSEAQQQYIRDNPGSATTASFQAGVKKLGRNLLQMATPKFLERAVGVSDEDMARKAAEEAPLEEYAPNANLAGQIAPTGLLGGFGGAVSLAGRVPVVGKTLTAAMTRLAAKPGVAAVSKYMAANPYRTMVLPQGAVLGAASAGPDDREVGALTGAATAGVLGKTLEVGGRALSSGLAPMTEKAKRFIAARTQLDPTAGSHLPVTAAGPSEGVGSGIAGLYNNMFSQAGSVGHELSRQGRDIGGSAYRATTRAAFGKNADDVLNVAMPGGKISEMGGTNTFRDAIPVGRQAYKSAFDREVLPGYQGRAAVADQLLDSAQQAVKPVLSKAAAQLTAAEQRAQAAAAQASTLTPAARAAEKASAQAKKQLGLAKTMAQEAELAAKEAAELVPKRLTNTVERYRSERRSARRSAPERGTPPTPKELAAVSNRPGVLSAQKAAQKAADDLAAAQAALKAARNASRAASGTMNKTTADEAAALAAQKTAATSLRAMTTKLGTAQSKADAALAKPMLDSGRAAMELRSMQQNPGIPSNARPYVETLEAATARSKTGNPTLNQLAEEGRRTATPQGDLVSKVALGADDLMRGSTSSANLAQRSLMYKIGGLALGTAGVVLKPVIAGKGFQAFLLGNTNWQNAINKAYQSGQGVAARKAVSQALRAYAATEVAKTSGDATKYVKDAITELEEG